MVLQPRKSSWLFAAGEIGFILIVAASIFAAILLSMIYIPAIPPGAVHLPALVMLYWAAYQPRWQPLVLIFIMGIIADLLSGSGVIGITAFIGVLLAAILRSQNHLILALPFWAVWLIIGSLMICWRAFETLASGVIIGIWPAPDTWVGSALLSALCFPLVAIVLSPLRRAEFRF